MTSRASIEDTNMRLSTRGGLVVYVCVMTVVCGGCAGDPQWATGGGARTAGQQLLHQPSVSKASVGIAAAARIDVDFVSRPYTGKSWISPRARLQPLLYISDFRLGVVNIYLQAGHGQLPVGVIGGLSQPQGLHVTPNGDLYVVSSGTATIEVYHRGQTAPFETLDDSSSHAEPVSVTVDPEGQVYAGHLSGNTISVFAKGSLTPTQTITDVHAGAIYFVAMDSTGKLFVSYRDPKGAGRVDVLARGKQTQLPFVLEWPGGLKLDKNDTLIVDDQLGPTISTYVPPYSRAPTNVIKTSGDPVSFALTSNEQALWDANALSDVGEEFSYLNNPSGPPGRLLDATSTGGLALPIDAACDPPGTP
jgi:hypothetical protein